MYILDGNWVGIIGFSIVIEEPTDLIWMLKFRIRSNPITIKYPIMICQLQLDQRTFCTPLARLHHAYHLSTLQVWKLYKEGAMTEAIDPLLGGDFPDHEAIQVMQIGLLCTQASATLRPSMTEVIEYLTTKGEDRQIPVPQQPPFLNARALVSRGLSSSSTSSPLTKMGISYTTSQSSTTPSSEWPLRIDETSSS